MILAYRNGMVYPYLFEAVNFLTRGGLTPVLHPHEKKLQAVLGRTGSLVTFVVVIRGMSLLSGAPIPGTRSRSNLKLIPADTVVDRGVPHGAHWTLSSTTWNAKIETLQRVHYVGLHVALFRDPRAGNSEKPLQRSLSISPTYRIRCMVGSTHAGNLTPAYLLG